MDVKNGRSRVRHVTEGRTSCENKPKGPPPRTSRSADMIARVEQMVMEDRRLTVRQIAANAGISVGSVVNILHDDLKLRKVSARWVPRGGGPFRFFPHDVQHSVNCLTREQTFFTSITPLLHVCLTCS
jgi:hypothetical protein